MVDPLILSGVAWGISTAGWIISPIVTKLVNKALSHIKPSKSKDELHDLLTNTLPRLALTLEAAEGSAYKDVFEELVKDLKSAFYDLEGILDEVEYVLHEKQLAAQKKCSRWTMFASRDDAGPSDQGVVSIEPSSTVSGSLNSMLKKKMKKIKELVLEANKTIELANLPCNNKDNRKNKPTVPATNKEKLAVPMEKVTGRDKHRLQITEMLRDSTEGELNASPSNGKCFSIIGIYGIPGSGKTTLAQYVCEYERAAGYFDLVMWIRVSQNFLVDTVYREMFEGAYNIPCPEFRSLESLRKELENKITGKRFLLVLDDVWCDKDVGDQELPLLLCPFMVGRRGSKILVTSRNAEALSDLGPNNRCTPIQIQELDEKDFFELFMYYALGDSRVDDGVYQQELVTIGMEIAHKLGGSPLAAKAVGAQLRRKQNAEHWRAVRDSNILTDTMGALMLSYQYLDEGLKRCFAYCSIFPRRHYLPRDELIYMWLAEGFIKTTDPEEELEAVARDYVDGLVSTSFLQTVVGNRYPTCYLIHDLLHDLAKKVAGRDCFTIEHGWTGGVPRDVRHLFIETVNGSTVIDKIVRLENLRTLIIHTGQNNPMSKETIEKVFTKLSKLRVLDMRTDMSTRDNFSLPQSLGKLKHLRYLCVLNCGLRGGLAITLPSTIAKLHNLQVLRFSESNELVLSSKNDMSNLTNLRILKPVPDIPNIGRMASLQVLQLFRVMKEQGYELHQLKNLNKLTRNLCIEGLELVESKQEALEAKLSDKERLKVVILAWGNHSSSNNLDAQADVLDGLCPPTFLEFLEIRNYQGSRSPYWTNVGNTNSANHLQSLWLNRCSRLGPATGLVEYFVHLRELILTECNWESLPNNIEQLKFLVVLRIQFCLMIRSIPVLPHSLKRIEFWGCGKAFVASCETSEHPNWNRIKHIPSVSFEGRQMGTGIIETQSLHWKQYVSL